MVLNGCWSLVLLVSGVEGSLEFLVSGVEGSLVLLVSGGKGSLELNGLAMLLVSGAFGLQGCSCVISLWACLVSSLESY